MGSTGQRTGRWHWGSVAFDRRGWIGPLPYGRGSFRSCGGGSGWGGGVVVWWEACVPGGLGLFGGLCSCHDPMMGRGRGIARGFGGWGANVRARGGDGV